MLGAMPQSNEARVKPPVEIRSRFLRPMRLANYPEIGMTMPLATKYEVIAQVASLGVAERLPAMCVKETLTTLVSSTSMKVASITAAVMSHGPSARLATRLVTANCLSCSARERASLAVPLDGNSQALTECPCERRGAEETPMGSPEGEKGFFT